MFTVRKLWLGNSQRWGVYFKTKREPYAVCKKEHRAKRIADALNKVDVKDSGPVA